MVSVEHIEGVSAFALLSDVWDELVVQGVCDTPFQRLAYQQAWFTHLGVGYLHVVVVRRDDELIGIVPLNLYDQQLSFNASKEESDYLDVIASADNLSVVWSAVIDYLLSPACFEWQTIDLWNLPAWSSSADLLQKLSAEHQLTTTIEQAEVCPCIVLPDSFDDYLATLDKKQRHEIKRKLRRSNGADATVRMVMPDELIAPAIDTFLVLLQKSTKEKKAWLTTARVDFFHEVAAAAQKQGILQLIFIELEGEAVAALLNFSYNGRTWIYNSGLDAEKAGRLSLGVVISARAIEMAIEQGHHTVDFLRGNESYKYRFGAADTAIYHLTITK